MSARAVISTATIDRVGDVLMPRGCRLDNFAKNPVVLWAHGLEGIGQPIATSQSPNGALGVTISDEEVQATAWFSQKSLEAAQIFELIDEGIVRATSVRETPIKSHLSHDSEAGDVLIVEEWDLEEWSWCAVGVNPDAVAKAIHRNRLGGSPIAPSIVKSLTAVAPVLRRYGVGFKTEKNVAESSQANDVDGDATEMDQGCPDVGESFGNQPYGSTVVSAVHASLATACQNIEDAMGPLENPAVKEGLFAILGALRDQIAALEGLHASNYPEQSELKDDPDGGEQDTEAMKAFLASGRIAALQVLGLGARLKGMVAARNLNAVQRRVLADVSEQLARLVSQSKASQMEGDELKMAVLQKSIDDLAIRLKSMRK